MDQKPFRPQAKGLKIHSKNEFELAYLRHQYLRKVDFNPSPLEMRPYQKIVEYVSKKTFYTYRYLFHLIGMELEDIASIGNVHLVNFIGLFALNEKLNKRKYDEFVVKYQSNNKRKFPDEKEILNKNKADCTLFLRQRMTDLVRICQQKAKNIKGMKVEEYSPFCGPEFPDMDLQELIENHEKHGFKKIDNIAFKAVKKRAKAKNNGPFLYSNKWYVGVPLEHRNLNAFDLVGAGLDPYEHFHNKNPEQILNSRQQEKVFDKKKKLYDNYPKEEKIRIMFSFIEENSANPNLQNEVRTAKRYLGRLGVKYVE